MESIDDKIHNKIKKCGRGSIFSSADFINLGEPKSILKALERMANAGTIVRVARGIYCYPKIDKFLGLGVIYPTFEEIAQHIAKRDKARIVPTGSYALNVLGLSTQVPANVVYLTDGSPRTISLKSGRGIKFIKTAPKNLAFKNKLAMLLTFALKEIGEGNVTEDQKQLIKNLLKNEEKLAVEKDYTLMPTWIQHLLSKLYEC
ncbi:MAG: type IV toxin-antitoxin system AbiEi family antitoxin domain-containing protein [Bacteroidales bacterium]|nr:type IV toxin-antitoxin system AbiEi family antitoxin domain-containing protein [Bacteroidales bacterium]